MSCSLHDAARFEALGLPVAVIATDAFVRPADDQLAALNFEAYRPNVVFISHPLASQPRDRVDAKADAALADVSRALLGDAAPAAVAVAPPGDRSGGNVAPRSAPPAARAPSAAIGASAEDPGACET